jgi:hypothetical protein
VRFFNLYDNHFLAVDILQGYLWVKFRIRVLSDLVYQFLDRALADLNSDNLAFRRNTDKYPAAFGIRESYSRLYNSVHLG